MVKLSIIIPVYNVEKYLTKCLDSVLVDNAFTGQVICVNDGSTDGSGKILEQYATKYPNVDIILQKNAGLSAARNSGIKAAKGEYVVFLDSDDYWEPNVLDGLLAQIDREELDVLRYNFQNVRVVDAKHLDSLNLDAAHIEYEVFSPNKAQKRDVDYSESVIDGEEFLNNRLGPMCYAWAFVIRRELLDGCIFKEGIYFEDTEWTPRMLVRAKRVASTPMIVYNYLWRTGSITLPTDPVKRKKVIDDKIALIRGYKEQSKMVKDPIWFEWMTSFTAMTILGMLAHLPLDQRKSYLKELKSLKIFPLSIKREKVLSHKIKTILANLSPALYCTLMHSRK